MKLLFGKPPVTLRNASLQEVSIDQLVKTIKTDTQLKKQTQLIRKKTEPTEIKRLKQSTLPYFLPFNYTKLNRSQKNFKDADYMVFEADHIENMDKVLKRLKQDKFVLLLYTSVSGQGFKMMIKLSSTISAQYYTRAYNVLRLMFNKRFEIVFDPSSKDLARVQFLAYDPNCYLNKQAEEVKIEEIVKRLEIYDNSPIDKKSYDDFDFSDDDIKKAIEHIRNKGYLETKDEQLWWELSMSIASLGEDGREYFLLLSQDHPLYPEDTIAALNKRYDKFVEAWGTYHDEERLLNMNAFFNIVEKHFKFKSPRHKADGKKSVEFVLADKFSNQFRDILLYDHSKSNKQKTYGWYIWDGTRFAQSKKGEISDFYLKFIEKEKKASIELAKKKKSAEEHLGSSDENPINVEDKDVMSLAKVGKAETRRYRDLTLTWAGEREGLGVLPDDLDKDVELFNCLNGVINIRTGKLLEHSPLFKMTKISPVIYQKNSKCPSWEEFIQKISFNNDEIADYIQEAVGYSLTGHTSEQCLFFLYGIGANGKSTFLEGLKLIFGDYCVHSNYETFTSFGRDGSSHSEDVVRLKGSRLVISTEINAHKTLNESVVKQITSGDTVTARDLHSSSIEFTPTFKLWIAGNHKPKLQNFDFGIKRRIFIIPFEYKFTAEEIRPQYEVLSEFKQERSGILSWALEGARRWFKRQGLKVPQAVLDTTREYFLENNMIEQFISEHCEVLDKDKPETIGIQEQAKPLYERYLNFVNGLNEDRLGRNQFYSRLEELGYKKGMSSSQQVIFRGIQLKPEPEQMEPERQEVSANQSKNKKRKELPE